MIERARARWEDEPKYPAHERPAPPARRRTGRGQGSAHDAGPLHTGGGHRIRVSSPCMTMYAALFCCPENRPFPASSLSMLDRCGKIQTDASVACSTMPGESAWPVRSK